MEWYLDWVRVEGITPRVQTLRRSLGDQFRLFNSGRLAMMTAGHFWVPRFRPYVADGRLDIGFAPIPHRARSPPATVVYASGWAVPAASPNRRLAVELAAALADSASQAVRVSHDLEISAIRSVADQAAASDSLGWERVFLDVMPTARLPWGARVRGWREVENRLPQVIDEVLLEGRPVREALQRAASDIDRILAETER
jgi:ABC-type glycerol-3-phosphate transport system substrate-binding protein